MGKLKSTVIALKTKKLNKAHPQITARKELRKQKKLLKKRSILPKSDELIVGKISNQAIKVKSGGAGLQISQSDDVQSNQELRKKKKKKELGDSEEDPEDLELRRLEKLLGIDKKIERNKAATKLNKEYEMYEGIGENFGDFLMTLDDLTTSIHRGDKQSSRSILDDVNISDDGEQFFNPILDDDEQETSDVEFENDENEESDEYDDMDAEEGSDDEVDSTARDDEEDNGSTRGAIDGDNVETDIRHTYRPIDGEDIYGRMVNESSAVPSSSKYVPPARRLQLSAVDETSEPVKLLKRTMNGLMNKLSDQSKDSIFRSMKALFESNSISICNNLLCECTLAACANPTQTMTTLIPTYASLIAALHVTIGVEVGAFMVESLSKSFVQALQDSHVFRLDSSRGSEHKLISSKLAMNRLLLLLYLYGLRVLHHDLIMDITKMLGGLPDSYGIAGQVGAEPGTGPLGEMQVEMLTCIVTNCGQQLRTDDPDGLKHVVAYLNSKLKAEKASTSAEEGADAPSRIRFMVDALTELTNSKSKRVKSDNRDAILDLRKWLGSVKASSSSGSGSNSGSSRASGGDSCLRVSLRDLLDADQRGRWWRAGASWAGKGHSESGDDIRDVKRGKQGGSQGDHLCGGELTGGRSKPDKEQRKLLKLAEMMHFNTSTRRSIFVVMMSSRDVFDAYERLARLELKGKEDREVIRVIFECCAAEEAFNPFYAELISLFCKNNRQCKTTLQFAFCDFFKVAVEDADSSPQRRCVNLGRLMSHSVTSFDVPLALLKRLDMTELSSSLMLFLTTFFIALFTSKISEDTFQNVLDRVATTKDYSTARDNIVFYLQSHFSKTPPGLNEVDSKLISRRRKLTVKTMESMSVLDIPKAAYDQEQLDGDSEMF